MHTRMHACKDRHARTGGKEILDIACDRSCQRSVGCDREEPGTATDMCLEAMGYEMSVDYGHGAWAMCDGLRPVGYGH